MHTLSIVTKTTATTATTAASASVHPGEIMETDPEGIQNGRCNGMETIDKEIFQQLVLSTEGRQRWS